MFYQILLFMPLKLWSGLFLSLFLGLHSIFLIFLQSRSLVSGHVCSRTPPEGAELADSDINRSIKELAGAISQINGGRMSSPRAQRHDRPIWKWSSLMDRDVVRPPARSLASSPTSTSSFIRLCYLLLPPVRSHGPAVCKSHCWCQKSGCFSKKLSSDTIPEMCDVCCQKEDSNWFSYLIIYSVRKCFFTF